MQNNNTKIIHKISSFFNLQIMNKPTPTLLTSIPKEKTKTKVNNYQLKPVQALFPTIPK